MKNIATREAYGKALVEIGKQNPNIIVMDADLSKSTKTADFKKEFPERFINMGISEQDLMATAAGIATCGKVVFASTFAMFAAGRAFEQIRNSIAHTNANVKIAATHSGITVGEDGATHQCIEDISLMRTIPNMIVINPADAVETKAAIKYAADYVGPVYIRLGRLGVPILYNENDYKFEIGKGIILKEGQDVTIIATGIMVAEALKACDELFKNGISAEIINIHTIKPIDKDIIVRSAAKTKAVLTAEEHSIIGGLGSAVAEVLSENCPTVLKRVGINDKFGASGVPSELMDYYGINANEIVRAATELVTKKNK